MSLRTQSVLRPRGVLAATLVALCAGLAPFQASAAQRLETIDLPSLKGNVLISQSKLNQVNSLQANVLLPDGYDQNTSQRYPVLYLLHGVGDNAGGWVDQKKGRIQQLANGMQAIIVMPEAGRGYFVDWWRDGHRTGSNWERYYFDEVIPAIEARYRILPGRQNHAIGGISMGGYGGLLYASQFPSYFGSAYSMSGLLDLQNANVSTILPIDIGAPFTRIWGKVNGPYATVSNPLKLVDTLKDTRVFVGSGNGKIDLRRPWSFSSLTSGIVAELEVHQDSLRIADRLRKAGSDVTTVVHTGVHDWPYWRLQFPDVRNWNPFAAPKVTDAAANTSWTYKTMAPYGNAWDLGYKFAAPPTSIATFTRSGAVLKGTGTGTVTITPGAADDDASGNGSKASCAFTATLPFEHTFAAGC